MKFRTIVAGLGLLAASIIASWDATALAGDTVKIGVVSHLTGPLAGGEIVTHTPNIDMWVKQVNDRGGLKVDGGQKPIELIVYDDQTNPTEHIKAVQRLVTQDEVDFMLSPYGTGFNLAVAPIFAKYGFPLIVVTAITDKIEELTKQFPNMYLGSYHNQTILFCCAYGAPRAVEPVHIFGSMGTPTVIQIGSCGGL
ncbi:MAG: hypothetical protein CFH38_01161, partial [Alphaproteobacteria bacterium MarineAlpha10_Bin1]